MEEKLLLAKVAKDFRRVNYQMVRIQSPLWLSALSLCLVLDSPALMAQSFPIEQTPADKQAQAESVQPTQPGTKPAPQVNPARPTGRAQPVRRRVIKKSRDNGIRYGFGVSYSLWQSWIFSGSVAVGSGSGFSAYINIPSALSLDFDVRYLPKNSLGFIGSWVYDLSNRTETGGRYGTAEASAEYSAGNFAISLMSLHANMAWRSGDIFYPVGLNYTIPKIVSSYYTGSVSAKGGLGWDLGIGCYFTPNLAAETYFKSLTVGFSGTGPSTDSFDKGALLMAGLNLKYIY